MKVGDQIREIDTGDIGIITKAHEYMQKVWWVKWDNTKVELFVHEDEIELYIDKLTLHGTTIVIAGKAYCLTEI